MRYLVGVFLSIMFVTVFVGNITYAQDNTTLDLNTNGKFIVQDAVANPALTVTEDKKVGVGTAAPAANLDVAGDVKIDSVDYIGAVDGNTRLLVHDTLNNVVKYLIVSDLNVSASTDWADITNIPAGFADGTDDGITVETDPTVAASVKDGVDWTEVTGIPADIADGDDGITTETDPIYSAWDKSTGISITESQVSDLTHFTNADETDPTVPASVKDGTDWTEVTSIPADIADGDDVNDADANPLNELNASVVLNGTSLEVTDAGGIKSADLSSLGDDADADPANELNTTVVLNGTTLALEITDAGGTKSADLSGLVDDADADPANELNTSVVLNGTNLEVTDAGGTIITDLSNLVAEVDPEVGANTTNYMPKWDGSALVTGTIIDDAGNIGIGTSLPWSNLHVMGAGTDAAIGIDTSSPTGKTHFVLRRGGSDQYDIGHDKDGDGGHNLYIYDVVNAKYRLNIENNGNVGLGTSLPWSNLHVMGAGTDAAIGIDTSSPTGKTHFVLRRGGSDQYDIGHDKDGDGSHNLYIYDVINDKYRFNIDNNGNVGIGTETPGAKLDVAGNIKIADGTQGVDKVLTSDANGLAQWKDAFTLWTEDSGNIYRATGNVGINTSTPATELDVAGTITATGLTVPGKNIITDTISTNTFLGLDSGSSITTGDNNTALGNFALQLNDTGYQNTAIGRSALVSNTSGFRNVAVGYLALSDNTTGYHNTAIGTGALDANTIGIENTATGKDALKLNTTGNANTANGYFALHANTTGGGNTAIGNGTLRSNTTGVRNTATGLAALDHNTTGGYNTANGSEALQYNTTASFNTALGYNALRGDLTSTGDNNTAVGAGALASYTTGNRNTAIGSGALRDNTTGVYNTAIGFQAMRENETGGNNTAIGKTALAANTAGINNTANGADSLTSNTLGNWNSAMGYRTLFSNSTGNGNTAMGNQAMYLNTSGGSNTAIGQNVLYDNTVGNSNTAIGQLALTNNTEGSNNVANGVNALLGNTLGGSNVAVGLDALKSNTTGNNNIAIGRNSLPSNVTSDNNVAIGLEAGHNATGSGNVFLGYKAGWTETGSDKLHIANDAAKTLIFGDFANDKVGINTTSPGGLLGLKDGNTYLDVDGSNNLTFTDSVTGTKTLAELVGGGTLWDTATGGIHYSSGSVGIGINSPAELLHLNSAGNTHIRVEGGFNPGLELKSTAANGENWQIASQGTVDGQLSFAISGGTNSGSKAVIDVNGNFGIGTTTPAEKLHVKGGLGSGGIMIEGSVSNFNNLDGTNGVQIDNDGNNARIVSPIGISFWPAKGEKVVIDTSGNVGIGTTSPDQLLSVNGGASKVGGGSWATFSDKRLKTINGTFNAGLEEVIKLNPIRYNYNSDNPLNIPDEGEHIGFIAQEVQKVLPEAVSKNSKGYLMVDNDPILWTMLNAIKELKAENDTFKSENDKLRNELLAIKDRQSAIEDMLLALSMELPKEKLVKYEEERLEEDLNTIH